MTVQQTLAGELVPDQGPTTSPSLVHCESADQFLLEAYARSHQHTQDCLSCSSSATQ